ncbi:MAG: sensor histidine kinase, partial [Chloroflexi bacterium]
FTAEDVQVQSTLASQIAVAVNTAQLFAEQLEVTDRLREVDRLKSEFLASMSHELRTPLNSIIGYAEVLLDGIDGDLTDDMTEDVSAIHGSGKHLLNLINDILDLAKIEASQMDLVMEAFQLAPLAEDTIGTQRVLLKDKPVDIVLDIPDELPALRADSLRVRQVLSNLVTNAIKFTEEGSITIRARCYELDPSMLQISVIDTGIGMRQDQLHMIFDRFRQVDQSHTRRAGGTGLGLSITRQLIQMHGGDIWVDSEPGVGSQFHFTLPATTHPVES